MSNSTDLTCGAFSCECPSGDDDEHASAHWLWFLGLALSLGGSALASLGMVLQKLAHNENESRSPSEKFRDYGGLLMSPRWISGFLLLVIIPLPLDLFSLGLAPQSIIAPMSGMTIIFCQVITPCVLKEKITCMDWVASFVITIGCVLVGVAGDQCSMDWTMDQIDQLYADVYFIGMEVIFAVLIVTSFISLYLIIPYCNPGVDGPQQICPRAKLPEDMSSAEKLCRAYFHAFLAGALGGQQNVLFKAIGECLEQTFHGDPSGWASVSTYGVLFVLVICAISQIMHLNKGMVLVNAVLFLPMYNSGLIICSSLSGLIFYQEYRRTTALGTAISVLAWAIIVAGIVILSLCGGNKNKEEDEKSDTEVELGVNPCAESPRSREVATASAVTSVLHLPDVDVCCVDPALESSRPSAVISARVAIDNLHGAPEEGEVPDEDKAPTVMEAQL